MYVVGNRSFKTWVEAAEYCNMVDFDFYTMIEYKEEE